MMTAFLYLRNGDLDNHYAHPLDLFVHLDMTEKRVLHERTSMHKEVSHTPLTRAQARLGIRMRST